MAKYALIKDGKIDNIIELDPNNYTTTFILNDRGDRLPTITVNGQIVISTTKYLPPVDCELVEYTGGNIGDAWPLQENPTEGV